MFRHSQLVLAAALGTATLALAQAPQPDSGFFPGKPGDDPSLSHTLPPEVYPAPPAPSPGGPCPGSGRARARIGAPDHDPSDLEERPANIRERRECDGPLRKPRRAARSKPPRARRTSTAPLPA